MTFYERKHHPIIKVDLNKFMNKIFKSIDCYSIKNSRCILESKGHYRILIASPFYDQGHFVAIHQRKFQLKMGLLTLTEIPCHHVLANEIALNLKYRIGLKHFFNINLGIGIIKKTTFLFVFLTYLPVFLRKFRSGELVGCGIKFRIQRVPTRHTFDRPLYP